MLWLRFARSADKDSPDVKVTSSTSTTLLGLLSFTNYSIVVLAFTGSGDGVRTSPIFCRTDEDGKDQKGGGGGGKSFFLWLLCGAEV